jgi:hypothetical protein
MSVSGQLVVPASLVPVAAPAFHAAALLALPPPPAALLQATSRAWRWTLRSSPQWPSTGS